MASDTVVRASMPAGVPVAGVESAVSAVTWSAAFAGALVAVAVSLALLVLGSALGLATISPWSPGEAAAAFGVGAAVWLIVTQWIASAFGGYLTGRLRTKWVGVHTDEVFFRDTAHGFLTWAVATVLMAALFASTAASVIGAGTQAVATVASGAAQGATSGAAAALPGMLDPTAYYVDRLLRPEAAGDTEAAAPPDSAAPAEPEPATPTTPDATAATGTGTAATAPSASAPATTTGPSASAVAPATAAAEVADPGMRDQLGRLLTVNLASEEFDANDRAYLVQVVSEQAGIDPATAEARIDEITAQAEIATTQAAEATDAARAAGATASLLFFLSLLVGAFIACVAAAIGGRQRDDAETVIVP